MKLKSAAVFARALAIQFQNFPGFLQKLEQSKAQAIQFQKFQELLEKLEFRELLEKVGKLESAALLAWALAIQFEKKFLEKLEERFGIATLRCALWLSRAAIRFQVRSRLLRKKESAFFLPGKVLPLETRSPKGKKGNSVQPASSRAQLLAALRGMLALPEAERDADWHEGILAVRGAFSELEFL